MKELRRIIIAVFCLFALSFEPLVAQHIVETVTVGQDEGIAHRNVEKVVRDRQGYFFLFMPGAIQRYDGSDFVDVDISALTDRRIKTSDISDVEVLADGSIGVVTTVSDVFISIPPHKLALVASTFEGRPLVTQGQLYSVTRQAALYSLQQAQVQKDKPYTYYPVANLPFEPTQCIRFDGDYYLTTSDSTIHRLSDGVLSSLGLAGRLISNGTDLLLWRADGVYKIVKDQTEIIVNLPPMNLTMLKKDKVGNIIASYSADPRIQTKLYVLTPELKLKSLDKLVGVSKFYRDFWTDDASYKWMLVGYNAIQVVNLMRDGVSIIAKNENSEKGKFGNVIGGVASDPSGNVYFSKESRGIYRMVTLDSAALVHKPATYANNYRNNERFYYSIYDEYYYNYGYLYDGSTDVYQSDFDNQRFTKRNVSVKIVDILPISAHKILIGGYNKELKDGRLATYDFKTESFRTLRDSLPRIRSLYYDQPNQKYWIGTVAGLYVMNSDFETVAVLDNRKDEKSDQFLVNDYIIMTNEFMGKMLVGTYGGGLLIINKNTLQLESVLDQSKGLTNNSVVGVMPDNIGNCWITTFSGVNVIDSSLSVIKTIYDHQGLNDREFNSKSITKDAKGHIYAGSLNGVTRFDPEKVLTWKESHGFDVTSVHAFEKEKSTDLGLDGDYTITDQVDSIIVNYRFPDYHRFPFLKGNVAFNWNTDLAAGAQHKDFFTLTNMKVGSQQLTATGAQDQQQAVLSIDVKRDYSTLLKMLGILAIIGLISYLIIRSNKHKEREKTELNKRLSELQLSSLQSQMNPHFIFNALGAIQYFIQTQNAEKADEYLSDFAQLMRKILESSKTKYIRLSSEIETLKLYIGLEHVRFEKMFEYEFILDEELDTDTNIPPMIIQPYIENAINHGLYNLTDRPGKLTVKMDQLDDHTIKISVHDNGVGRVAAKALRTKRHKSRGMQIIDERIQTINNSQDLVIDVQVKDLMVGGQSAGTKVEIILTEPD